jgi:hypothetical protein
MTELRAIGNNLNQVAHRTNATDVIEAELYKENVDTLTKITDELMGVFLPKKKR